jgi:hypothetical protein
LRGRRSERENQRGVNLRDFRIEPRLARANLDRFGFGVDAALAAFDELEMFDRVRDIDVARIDPGVMHRSMQKLPGGSDERMTLAIFAIARLLADEHHARVRRPFAEDRLRCEFIQVASATMLRRLAQALERNLLGKVL